MISLILYVVVLLISVSSVLFGLGWLSTPAPQYKTAAMQVASQSAPAPKTAPRIVLKPLDPPAYSKKSVKTATANGAPTPPSQTMVAPAATTGSGPSEAARSAQAAATPPCDIRACSAAYRSFRASDCTYQPFNGPRRLCTKVTPPSQAQAGAPATSQDANAQADAARAQAPACNVAACEAAYKTFDPSDCTYQPYNGPRRPCTK